MDIESEVRKGKIGCFPELMWIPQNSWHGVILKGTHPTGPTGEKGPYRASREKVML